MLEFECVVDAKAGLGEGPLWDPRDRVLWWVNIKAREIHCFDPATGKDRQWSAPDDVGARRCVDVSASRVGARVPDHARVPVGGSRLFGRAAVRPLWTVAALSGAVLGADGEGHSDRQ